MFIYIYTHTPKCMYKILTPSLQCHVVVKIEPSYTQLEVVSSRTELHNCS